MRRPGEGLSWTQSHLGLYSQGASPARCRQDLLSVLMEAGHRAPSLYLEPPASYWPCWLLGDRSYPVWAQGAHSLGWFILIFFRLTHHINKSEQPFTVCQVISDSIFQGVVIPTQGGITVPVCREGNWGSFLLRFKSFSAKVIRLSSRGKGKPTQYKGASGLSREIFKEC